MSYLNTELGFVITRPNNVYAKLDKYNSDNLIGPPLNPNIPPMQYIHLPREHQNYGYDTLSHDFNGIGYYNVETGYGNKCTTFDTARCPGNRVIQAPMMGAPSAPSAGMPAAGHPSAGMPATRENYSAHANLNDHVTTAPSAHVQQAIKDMHLDIYLDTARCPHSQSMLKLLQDNGIHPIVSIHDINNPAVRQQLVALGGNGVPFVRSNTLGTTVTGLPPNVSALIKSLQHNQPVHPAPHAVASHGPALPSGAQLPPQLAERIKDLQLTVYVSDSCHYCTIYKQFLNTHGLRPYIKMVNVGIKAETDTDAYLQTNTLPGYPFTYSRKYQTSFPGVPSSINEILNLVTTQST